MSLGERYAYYRDRTQESQQQVYECDFPPSEKHPQHIESHGKAAGFAKDIDVPSKGTQGEKRNAEKLHSERDSDYRAAHQQSRNEVHQEEQETSQDEPKNIAYKTHDP